MALRIVEQKAPAMHIGIIRLKYSSTGGAEKIIQRIIQSLSNKDSQIEFTIFSGQWASESKFCSPNLKPPSNFNVVNLGLGGIGRYWRQKTFLSAAKRATESMSKLDIIQSHERMVGSDIFRAGDGVHRAWLNRLADNRGRFLGRLLEADPYHRLICNNEAEMARDPRTIFVANSPLCKREIRDFLNVPDDRVVTIPNTIDSQRWRGISRTESSKSRAKRFFTLNPDLPCVVFVGSGFYRKGLEPLIRAVGMTMDLQLVVVGSDKSTRRYESLSDRLASGRVSFLGPTTDIDKVLEAADVFCLPSLYDSFSNACLEALAAGIPVVTTRDCGISDYIEREGGGRICLRHPESILESIQYCIDNAARLRTEASTLAQQFDHTEAAQAWTGLYERLLDLRACK